MNSPTGFRLDIDGWTKEFDEVKNLAQAGVGKHLLQFARFKAVKLGHVLRRRHYN